MSYGIYHDCQVVCLVTGKVCGKKSTHTIYVGKGNGSICACTKHRNMGARLKNFSVRKAQDPLFIN